MRFMKRFWLKFGRLALALTAAVWLQLMAHIAVCHSENVMCGHDGCTESTVCVCVCHIAIEPSHDIPAVAEPVMSVRIPVADESILALLLPDDIFRPPLAQA